MSYPEFSPVRDDMWVEINDIDIFRSAVGTKCIIEIYISYLRHYENILQATFLPIFRA